MYLQVDSSVVGCSKQPTIFKSLVDQTSLPAYSMAEVRTVADLWQEWKVGLRGAPPIEELEQRWGARWRPQAAQKTAFCRRKVILDEINRLVDLGQTIDLAVA